MRDCIKGCGDKTNAASGICFSCGDGQCIVSKEQKFICCKCKCTLDAKNTWDFQREALCTSCLNVKIRDTQLKVEIKKHHGGTSICDSERVNYACTECHGNIPAGQVYSIFRTNKNPNPLALEDYFCRDCYLMKKVIACAIHDDRKVVAREDALGLPPANDPVNHPSHYTSHPSGVECIDIIRHHSCNIGNVIKYLWRAGLKDPSKEIEDMEKAMFYLKDEIERFKQQKEKSVK